MDAKDYAAACPKLEESYRLNPGGGTLLNLALCHEQLGKTATAWAEFHEAQRLARRDNRPDREKFATEHVKKLEPALSHLRIVVTDSARTAGLVIRRNGVMVGEGAWGESIPVDPGEQVVDVTAPGKAPERYVVKVAPDGGKGEVQIGPLKEAEATTQVVTKEPGPTQAPGPRPAESGGPPLRTYGLITGGVGIVALGVGGYLALRARDLGQSADQECPNIGYCQAQGVRDSQSAVRTANIATGFFVGGTVLLGAGVALYFLAPERKVNVGLAMTQDGAGAHVWGAF